MENVQAGVMDGNIQEGLRAFIDKEGRKLAAIGWKIKDFSTANLCLAAVNSQAERKAWTID